jgi:pre-mRNA-splicing factor ATP-dependent RNA helicase DHX15/PRP43
MIKNIGILDPDGKELNPLTNKPYSNTYKNLANIWRKFPAYENAKDIINTIIKNQVTLVISGTGSGKTVLLPKYLLHVLNYEKKIAITLPKQIIAQSAAEFAAKTLDVELGKDVGYKFKGSDKKGYSKENKLLYATDGTIVAKLLNDPELREFDGVVIDEAHERKVQIDFLLYLLKNTVKMRPEFKLVIMSATVNQEIFKSYFESDKIKFEIINVGAKTNYPIDSIFLNEEITEKQYINKGYDILKQIVLDNKEKGDDLKDILFFVTSSNEAKDLCAKAVKDNLDVFCVEVYSGMDEERQKLAQDKDLYKTMTKKSRKLVIATNVAESSLTIDGIRYVIDSGFEIFGYFDADKQAKVIGKRLITHAQAKQRMGRTGRTSAGTCYHLYTKEQFEKKMERFPEPTIRTSNIYGECLKLLILPSIHTTDKLLEVLMQLIEPPREAYIRMAITTLEKLNLIKNNKITDLGMIVGDMQTDPMPSICILMGKVYNCSKEVSAIFAMTEAIKENLSELFMLPNMNTDNEQEKQRMRGLMNKFKDVQKKLAHKDGDHLSLLKIFTKYRELKTSDKKNKEEAIGDFCYQYFLKKNVLDKAYKSYKKIKDNVAQIKDVPLEKNDDIMNKELEDRILYCLNYGFDINTAKLNSDKETYTTSTIKYAKLNQNNFIQYKHINNPKELIYQGLLISSGKNELTLVSKKY